MMQNNPESLQIHHTVSGNFNYDTGLELRPGVFLSNGLRLDGKLVPANPSA